MKDQQTLTNTQLKYLLAVARLCLDKEQVRSVEIANVLGVKKPSVRRMIVNLEQQGYVNQTPYGLVSLTEKGKEEAAAYNRHYMMIRDYCLKVMHLTKDTAERTAHCLIYHISSADLSDICHAIESGV